MLKQLRLKKQLEMERTKLEELNVRKAETLLKTQNLERSIEEAKTDDDLTLFAEEETEINTTTAAQEVEAETLSEKIRTIEAELSELAKLPAPTPEKTVERHEATNSMNKRTQFFAGFQRNEVDEMMKREDTTKFVSELRSMFTEKRAVTGSDLNIPNVFLDLLRDNLDKYSKLITKVNKKSVRGTARQNIVGSIPEAVWTEMVGALNALAIGFNQIEVDGYKVGGFVSFPNSIAKDSDVNLVSEVMVAIGQAIGLALDKAILYGTGAKMPVGIMKRLAEIAAPAYWGSNEKAWTDLHTTHLSFSVDTNKGAAFYEDLVAKLSVISSKYATGDTFWAMARTTFSKLQIKALSMSAAGAIVTGQDMKMPIVGGDIVILDFIPDGVIIGGYGSVYLLVEREGAVFAASTEAQFIEDNTVVKGIARYDGRPVFGEAFVAVAIGAAAPTATAVTFAADTANA